MLQSTQGIVLHTTPFSESSIVAKIYTQKWGMQSFLINSVRSAKAKNKPILFQPLTIIELEAYHKQNRGLQKISKVHNTLSLHQSASFDPAKAGLGFFIAEIIYKTIKEEHPDAELFDFLVHSIHQLVETQNSIANFHLAFMIEYSRFLGFYPQYNQYDAPAYFDLKDGNFMLQRPMHMLYVDIKESAVIESLMKSELSACHTIQLSRESRKLLLDSLLLFYSLHISNWSTIKSLQVLEDLFS